MTYAVRKASPDDVEDLVTLLNEIDAYYGDTTTDTEALRSERIAAVVAYTSAIYVAVAAADDGSLVGLASCSFLWPAEGSNKSVYMKELFVRESYRRCGVGRLLFAHVCELAGSFGCTRVDWTAESVDQAAAAFYASIEGATANRNKVVYRKTF